LADRGSYTVTTYIKKTKRREGRKGKKRNKRRKRRKSKLNNKELKGRKHYQVIPL